MRGAPSDEEINRFPDLRDQLVNYDGKSYHYFIALSTYTCIQGKKKESISREKERAPHIVSIELSFPNILAFSMLQKLAQPSITKYSCSLLFALTCDRCLLHFVDSHFRFT